MNKVKPSKERAYLTILLAQPSQCMSTFKITVTELFLSSFFFSATASPSSSSFFFSASLLPLLLLFSLFSFSLLLLLFFFFCKNLKKKSNNNFLTERIEKKAEGRSIKKKKKISWGDRVDSPCPLLRIGWVWLPMSHWITGRDRARGFLTGKREMFVFI